MVQASVLVALGVLVGSVMHAIDHELVGIGSALMIGWGLLDWITARRALASVGGIGATAELHRKRLVVIANESPVHVTAARWVIALARKRGTLASAEARPSKRGHSTSDTSRLQDTRKFDGDHAHGMHSPIAA